MDIVEKSESPDLTQLLYDLNSIRRNACRKATALMKLNFWAGYCLYAAGIFPPQGSQSRDGSDLFLHHPDFQWNREDRALRNQVCAWKAALGRSARANRKK
jgi:hypothetical protein